MCNDSGMCHTGRREANQMRKCHCILVVMGGGRRCKWRELVRRGS